jgi:hypothetical protein
MRVPNPDGQQPASLFPSNANILTERAVRDATAIFVLAKPCESGSSF